MENKAGGSELPGTCVGRIHPGPGRCLFLLSGSGHCEEASSLPTLPSWYDCFASHLRAVVSGSHGLNTVHPRAIVNPHSCLLLLSYTCQNNEKNGLRQSSAVLVSVTHSLRSMVLEYFAFLCLLHELGISFASESEASPREGQHPSTIYSLAQDGAFIHFSRLHPIGHPSSLSPSPQP